MRFDIYPAIDLRRGKVVRLEQGDPRRKTVFGDDPVAVAERWRAAGARWLHVINLDGALDEAGAPNWHALAALGSVGLPIQFGGGIRTGSDIERALDQGAQRVLVGTMAVEAPTQLEEAIRSFGADRIAVALDARDGVVQIHGWQEDSRLSAVALGRRVRELGVSTVIHTDIRRDGVLSGANVAASKDLAAACGLKVIVSGGVASLEDVRSAVSAYSVGVCGIIIGRALYEGKVDLETAISIGNPATVGANEDAEC